jgi:hypothetical protein
LAESGKPVLASDMVTVTASGAEAAPQLDSVKSPETYIGFARAENFVSPGGAVPDAPHGYSGAPAVLNQWSLDGNWTISGEHATLNATGGKITYKFHARDLHLVLGPSADGGTVGFKVKIDGAEPGADHGTDFAEDGRGEVKEQRLYQLVRQAGQIPDRTFEIEFLDPGVQAFAFTFG